MTRTLNIAGRLHTIADDGVLISSDELLDERKNKKQNVVNADVDSALADRYTKSEVYTKQEVNNLVSPNQNYVTVAEFTDLPISGATDTIYRVSSWDGSLSTPAVDVTKYSEYAWDDTGYVFLCVKTQIGEVYDISAANSGAKYADLSSALGVDGGNVPSEIRRGGMSVKFVQSSGNKYVQYRLMSNSFNTALANWQGVDDGPTSGSDNLVKSGGVANKLAELESVTFNVENSEYISVVVDANGRCVKGITKDGSIHIFSDLSFKGNKEYGEDNRFFIKYVCDKDGKILEGIDKKGNKILYTNVNVEREFMLKGKKISDITQNHIYHIGKGSDYKYTTLREGIAEATRYERSIVYVHEGTYDLIEEWRTEVSQRLTYQFGNRLCNGIELVFLAGSKVVAHAELSNEVRTNFNPFYIEGSCSIIGLNIDVSNVRYCVHDEGLGQFKADIYYKNCVMKNHSDIYIDAEGKPHCFHQCIGGGMGAHTNVHIENCVFDSAVGGDTNTHAVSYHNGISNYNCEGSVFVSNCYFAGQNSLRAQSYGVSTKMSMMYANNNSFGNPIECVNENTHKNFDVLEWNNVIRN